MTHRYPYEPNRLIALPEDRLIETANARPQHKHHQAETYRVNAEAWEARYEAIKAGRPVSRREPPPLSLSEPMPLTGLNREIFETALAEVERDDQGTFSKTAFTLLIASKLPGTATLPIAEAIVARAQLEGGTHQEGWIEIE